MSSSKNNGFSLIELSLYLVIAGVILASGAKIYSSYADVSKYIADKEKLNNLATILENYYKINGFLPCPARNSLKPGDANFGFSEATCANLCSADYSCTNNIVRGAIPFKTLNISQDLATDIYGNKIHYAMDLNFNKQGYYCNLPGKITVQDVNSNFITNNAAFTLLASGPNAIGAYKMSNAKFSACGNSTVDSFNCSSSNAFRIADYNTNSTSYFDDAVAFKSNTLRQTCPSGLSGCIFWHDASQLCSITQNSTNVVSGISNISYSLSATGSAIPIANLATLSQSSATFQPSSTSNAQLVNARKLTFNGDFLTSSQYVNLPTTNFTISLVFSSTSPSGVILGLINGSGYTNFSIYLQNSLLYFVANGVTLNSNTSIISGTNYVVTITMDSVNGSKIYVNGSLAGSNNDTSFQDNSLGYFRIGGDGISNYFTGSIMEVSIFNKVLDVDNRIFLEKNLSSKWNTQY